MTILTNKNDIQKIKVSGEIIKKIFSYVGSRLVPGISTLDLDHEIEDIIRALGGIPAFKGYKGFPASICTSVNEVVVHGIPSRETVLREGDILSLDVGVKKEEYFTDAARTFPVGEISSEAAKLVEVTKRCLEEGIKQAVAGGRVSDISNVVENIVRRENFQEVRAFVGHGTGKNLHEAPEVPNWGEKGKGPVLKEGLVLAIEPMINAGTREIKVLSDGWTAVTIDGKLSAHFEDTIIVGQKEAEIIT